MGERKSKILSFIVPLFLALSPLVFGTTTLDEKGEEEEDGSFVVCLLIPQRIYIFPLCLSLHLSTSLSLMLQGDPAMK